MVFLSQDFRGVLSNGEYLQLLVGPYLIFVVVLLGLVLVSYFFRLLSTQTLNSSRRLVGISRTINHRQGSDGNILLLNQPNMVRIGKLPTPVFQLHFQATSFVRFRRGGLIADIAGSRLVTTFCLCNIPT